MNIAGMRGTVFGNAYMRIDGAIIFIVILPIRIFSIIDCFISSKPYICKFKPLVEALFEALLESFPGYWRKTMTS